jgi:hypothetical protein
MDLRALLEVDQCVMLADPEMGRDFRDAEALLIHF